MAELELPALPFERSGGFRLDTAALAALAERYREGARDPSFTRFLFGWLPTRLFDTVLGSDSPGVPPPGYLYALYASGVIGGWWLRRELRAAQPEGMLASVAVEPTRETYDAHVAKAREALDSAAGSDDEAIAHAEAALPAHVDAFGYNLGYLLEIVELPPADAPTRDGFVRAGSLLWAEYDEPRLAALPPLRVVADHLETPPDARWEETAEGLLERQGEEEARGRQVWSSGLSAEGLSDEAYTQLLDVSGSFLEVIQATALTAAQAVAARDAQAARRAAVAAAGLSPWLGGYGLGLLDPAHDDATRAPWPRWS